MDQSESDYRITLFKKWKFIHTSFGKWLVLTIFSIILTIYASGIIKWSKLNFRGVETTGTVKGKEPNNHNTIRYSFKIDSEIYNGAGQTHGANPTLEKLDIGDKIIVIYDPENPNISCACDPNYSFCQAIGFLSSILAFFSFYGLFILYKYKKKHV